MTIRTANAPVSWGIWGANSLPEGRTPAHILRAISEAGYEGVELGPLGFFGDAENIASVLGEYELNCAGMYVPLRIFEGGHTLRRDLEAVSTVAEVVSAAGGEGPVVIAEETIECIKHNVARGEARSELDLDDEQWSQLYEAVEEARHRVEAAGLEATFHPHTGTHVEQPWETDRLLENTRIGLTLDTGHAAAGGDDPAELLKRWSGRVNHIHIKDMDSSQVASAQRSGSEFSMAEASVALGEGDLELETFFSSLESHSYSGWVVVEQDRRPDGGHDHGMVDHEQKSNLNWVQRRLQK